MPTAVTTHQRRDTFHVPKRKQSVPDARSQVRKILSDWGIDSELACDVAAVSTELVANAIQHCRVTYARIEVTVCMRGDGLLVEVSDPDRGRVPALCLGDDQGESGRGWSWSPAWLSTGGTSCGRSPNAYGPSSLSPKGPAYRLTHNSKIEEYASHA